MQLDNASPRGTVCSYLLENPLSDERYVSCILVQGDPKDSGNNTEPEGARTKTSLLKEPHGLDADHRGLTLELSR